MKELFVCCGVVKGAKELVSLFFNLYVPECYFILRCVVCTLKNVMYVSKNKLKMTTGTPQLYPIRVKQPWYHISIDKPFDYSFL